MRSNGAAVRKNGSFRLSEWAEEQGEVHDLNRNEAHLLDVYCGYADYGTGYCYPGLARLARRMRVKERMVSAAITGLREKGLIVRRPRGPGKTSDTYLLAPFFPDPPGHDSQPVANHDSQPAANRTSQSEQAMFCTSSSLRSSDAQNRAREARAGASGAFEVYFENNNGQVEGEASEASAGLSGVRAFDEVPKDLSTFDPYSLIRSFEIQRRRRRLGALVRAKSKAPRDGAGFVRAKSQTAPAPEEVPV